MYGGGRGEGKKVKHLIFVMYSQPLMTQFYEILKMHKSEGFQRRNVSIFKLINPSMSIKNVKGLNSIYFSPPKHTVECSQFTIEHCFAGRKFNCENHKVIWLITQFTQSSALEDYIIIKFMSRSLPVPFNWIKLHILLYKSFFILHLFTQLIWIFSSKRHFIVCSYSMSFSYGFQVSSGFLGDD